MPDALDAVYCAFEDAVQSDALKEVARHWRDICRDGGLPRWRDVRPSSIKGELPIIWFYEYDPARDDFIGRLAGNRITGVTDRAFKGALLSQIRPVEKYPRSLIRARRVMQEPALYRGQGLVYSLGQGSGMGERIALPLRGDDASPAGIFGATEFKSLSEWDKTSLNRNGEDEFWFSLTGLVS